VRNKDTLVTSREDLVVIVNASVVVAPFFLWRLWTVDHGLSPLLEDRRLFRFPHEKCAQGWIRVVAPHQPVHSPRLTASVTQPWDWRYTASLWSRVRVLLEFTATRRGRR